MKVTASRSPEDELADAAEEDVEEDEYEQAINASGRVSKEPIGSSRLERMTVDSHYNTKEGD